ncbi:25S rRNA (adenine(2142)-N(1))-methyltransferase, Bmt2 [Lasallia pustulata]|uniref:25S rRNA adenine-N(1) methyltransferase n=1 Tax=Lasallia pustulata TaxID=136370 RepID=A0A1W5CY65_9LECA|nr:25S rRNA (adenine(2142)-N(1))-methyltransferase, Bmt2 [Lasallia pustulata]
MPTKKRKKSAGLLSHGRPPTIQKPATLSSQATRSLIRTHHALQKRLTAALAANNTALAASLQAQIDAAGGLPKYQQASITGQSSNRGGDSSRVLVDWLSPLLSRDKSTADAVSHPPLRLLEVGALSPSNACSRSPLFSVTRIDLHSQHPSEIEEQDFMERPVPEGAEALDREGFDVVSLSLVVNYVPDAAERGEMLRRVVKFLRRRSGRQGGAGLGETMPALFLVLPAPCVLNSRYLDEGRLEAIMGSLGYVLKERKVSRKLVYYLWRLEGSNKGRRRAWKKEELKPGGARNNFAIVLQ